MYHNSTDEALAAIRDRCYQNKEKDAAWNRTDKAFCGVLFDQLGLCWPKTPVGHVARVPCSNEHIKSTIEGAWATRNCTENGDWYISPETNGYWADISECGGFYVNQMIYFPVNNNSDDQFYITWLPVIDKVTKFGYILSLLALIIGCFTLGYIKRLRCARNRLHLHLFISFILKAVMALIKGGLFINDTVFSTNVAYFNGEQVLTGEYQSWICKAVISLWLYFILSNYFFLLMEGTYLHNLMFLNLFSDKCDILIYCIIGWGMPSVFILPWIILRKIYDDDLCWIKVNNYYISFLIDIPIGLSVIVNFILFILVVRVLCRKLNAMYIQQRRIKYRKLLRSTLILVPLFGVPYIISMLLSIYRYKNIYLEVTWILFDQSFAAFQGLLVTLIYCLMNSEVQTEIRRQYFSFMCRKRDSRRSRTISCTQQCSLPHSNDVPDILLDNLKPVNGDAGQESMNENGKKY